MTHLYSLFFLEGGHKLKNQLQREPNIQPIQPKQRIPSKIKKTHDVFTLIKSIVLIRHGIYFSAFEGLNRTLLYNT